MHAMSALLDSLMGADRNELPEERQTRKQSFHDPEVCKYFLVSFCPHDLFPNTRSDLGPCPRVHKESLKEAYDKASDRGNWAPQFESEMISFLEQLIVQAEQKIDKANRRIDAPLPDNALLSEEQQEQVDKMHEEISKLLKEAEKAGERGDVEEAATITRNVQTLRREAERASNTLYGSYMQREKSLRVCPICGAMQSVGDSMSRFESHVTGKQHIGFEKIRSCLEELKRRREERGKNGGTPSEVPVRKTSDRYGGDRSLKRPRWGGDEERRTSSPQRQRQRWDNRSSEYRRPADGEHRHGDPRRGDGDPRRGDGDTRRGDGDTRRGDGDSRRRDGDSRRGDMDSRRGEGDSRRGDLEGRSYGRSEGSADGRRQLYETDGGRSASGRLRSDRRNEAPRRDSLEDRRRSVKRDEWQRSRSGKRGAGGSNRPSDEGEVEEGECGAGEEDGRKKRPLSGKAKAMPE